MKFKFSLFLLMLALSSYAFAVEVGAFGNIRAAMTTIDKDVTYNDITNRPGVSSLSQVGINFSQSLSDHSHGLVQVLYSNTSGANLDLFQIKHQQDEYTFRLGKQRIPLLMVSEHVQVAALLPWVSAPTEVYGKLPFNSFSGASIERRFGPFSALLFAGDSTETLVTPATGASYSIKTRGFHGARLELNTDMSRLYMGYAGFDGTIDVASQTPISAGSSSNVIYKFKDNVNNFQMMTVGGKVNFGKHFLMSEYLDARSGGFIVKRERSGYVSVGTVIKEKWQPIATVSQDFEIESEIFPSRTTSYDLGLLYFLDSSSVLKAGVKHVDYNEKTATASALPSTANTTNNGLPFSASPSQDFNVYTLDWSFIF